MPRVLELQQKAGYESFWAAIRTLKVFTRQDLLCELGKEFGDNVNADTVKSYLQRLRRGGFIELSGYVKTPRCTRLRQYTLINDIGVSAPRLRADGSASKNGAVHEVLWRSMKVLGNFEVRELQIAATTELTAPSADETRDYCNHLCRAGYLKRNDGRFQFIRSRYTGPRPPVITRVATVYDANLRQLMHVNPLEVEV